MNAVSFAGGLWSGAFLFLRCRLFRTEELVRVITSSCILAFLSFLTLLTKRIDMSRHEQGGAVDDCSDGMI